MIRNPAAARRYARALFAAARAAKAEEEIGQGLAGVSRALARPEIVSLVADYRHSAEKKEAGLAAAVRLLALSPEAARILARVLHLLLRRRRAALTGEISEAYAEILDESRGIRRVLVRSAVALDDTARAKMETSLRARTGGDVRATYEVDPGLLGGCVAQIGDLRLDGSVAGILARLEERLSA